MGMSLWLVPSPADAQKLKIIMAKHPPIREMKSSSTFAHFEPHITLCSIPSTATSLATLLDAIPPTQKALSAVFTSIEVGDHYFRSAFIAIEHSEELKAIHAHIHAKLRTEPNTPRYPHLSLCYVHEEDVVQRQRYVDRLGGEGRIERREDGLTLFCGDNLVERLDEVRGTEIWVARCEGPVEDWAVLEKIQLR